MTVDIESLDAQSAEWVGREHEDHDRITARPADILNATFDREAPRLAEGDAIAPGWHWLYFHEVVPLASTGHDGHPLRGEFLPSVPLPRRMWAGNRMQFSRTLHVGELIRRHSRIERVQVKSGSSGALCFVTVAHELHGEQGLATREEHDIVYREAPRPHERPRTPPCAPDTAAMWCRQITPSPVLLFRFSALTMNSHRIHYDRDFCTREEGYPGLLVHGPLTMLLLLDGFTRYRAQAVVRSVTVRATSPLFDTHAFNVKGVADDSSGEASTWASNPHGALAMDGRITFEP